MFANSWINHLRVDCRKNNPVVKIDFEEWKKEDQTEFRSILERLLVPTRPENGLMKSINSFDGYDLPLYMFVINECTGVADSFMQPKRDDTSIVEKVSDFLTSHSLAETDSDWWSLRIVSTRTQIGCVRVTRTQASDSKNVIQKELSLTKSLANLVLADKI